MSTAIESPFGNFCRACMIQDNEADTEFQSIFDDIPNSDKRILDLLNVIGDCNTVIGMPTKMCKSCVQRISDTHEFLQKWLQTQLKYQQLTEKGKYPEDYVASSDSLLDANVEESDPLTEANCMPAESMEADGRKDPSESSRYSDDESKYRQLTERGKHPEDYDASSDSLLDANVEESDPLTEDICMPAESMEADGRKDPSESSRYSDDEFNWPSDEEKDVISAIQTNKEAFGCDVCHRNFKNSRGLTNHKYWKHEHKGGLVCGTCGQTFTKRGPFEKHKLKHKSQSKEKNTEMKETPQEHSEEQQAPSVSQSEELSNSLQSRKPQKPKTCEICHKVFANLGNLNIHKNIHTGEKPFLCKECGKSFRCPTSLAKHERRHTGVRQYECPFCPMKFFDSGNLISHKRTHSDIKPHVCDVCGVSFKFSYSLNKHKLYHGEKSVKCEQCDMRFYSVGGMRRHLLTHTGEKPYKCKYCERAFAQPNDLIKHMKVHLGNNIYRCELCPMGFPMLKEKRKHFALHKNDDEATRKTNLEALAEYERNLSQQIKREKDIQV